MLNFNLQKADKGGAVLGAERSFYSKLMKITVFTPWLYQSHFSVQVTQKIGF